MFNMETCKTAATPRQRLDHKKKGGGQDRDYTLLDREASSKYRSGFLTVDRPDTSETAKMLAQAVGKPKGGHLGLLKLSDTWQDQLNGHRLLKTQCTRRAVRHSG